MPGDIPGLLAMAFRGAMDEVHTRLAEEGFADVQPRHGFVFQYLSWHPLANPVELGHHLGMTKQAAVQLVEELEKRGYVERLPHPTDGRSRVVILTDKGWACINRVVAIWGEIEERWASLIGADRLQALRDDLATFVADTGNPSVRPLW